MKGVKKKYFRYFTILLISSLFLGCVSSKKINYFNVTENQNVNDSFVSYQPTLQVGDILTINVAATEQDAAWPFNLFETPPPNNLNPLPYIINAEGEINFPVLGKIKAAELTTIQLTNFLTESLLPYLKDPVINMRILNFKVNVLGEVRNPGSYPVLSERISIIEALGLAGDLTIYGDRQNITLVREKDGKRTFETIDLTNKNLFETPYFYLSQNDALFVPANKTKVNSSAVGPNTSVIISSISILVTLIAILIR
jgi:polysaccharide export outer membrane protein